MLVVFDNNGQTCNKFWCYTSQIKYCINHHINMILVTYDITIDDYSNFKKCSFIKIPLYSSYFNKKIGIKKYNKILLSLFYNRFYDLKSFLFRKFPGIFINSWKYLNVSFTAEEKEYIRFLFMPDVSITESVDKFISQLKSEYDIVAGLHIRWGDYKVFNNGKYFLSLDGYKQICEAFVVQKKVKIAFLICSNEKIDLETLQPLRCFTLPNGTVTHDLYALSRCDYIIGVPSSFTRWASFMNDVPLHFIENIDKSIERMEFKIVSDFYHYNDNSLIVI